MRARAAFGWLAVLLASGLLVGAAGAPAAGPRALTLVNCTDKPPIPKPRSCNFRVPEYSSYVVKKLNWKHWGARRDISASDFFPAIVGTNSEASI